MKRKLQNIINGSAVSVLAFSVIAQCTPGVKAAENESTISRVTQTRVERINDAAKASEVIGMTVKNNQDEKIGKVEDLAVDVESGRIIQVILSTGGFLGVGGTLTAVPPGVLHPDTAAKVLRLDATKEKLKAAPRFDLSKWDESTRSNQVIEVYSYYGEEPYFIARHDAATLSEADANRYDALPRNMDGTVNTDGGKTAEKVRNAEIALDVEANTHTVSTRNPDGTWTRKHYLNENGAYYSWPRLGYAEKASKLIGTPVQNLQNEKIGKVENFIVDLSSGRIIAIIVSSGGFIGMGDELSAIPPVAFQFNAEHDTLQLDASKEMLTESPHFKANQWPDLSQPAYAGGVYHAYNVKPYFTTDATTDADNTRQNVRDRDQSTLTPMDQGSSQADINITAQIRKEIIAAKGMSMNARNVKIITKNGQVTLRGPVNTTEEKQLIGEIASRIANSGNVNNELEVKLTTTSNN